VQVPGVARLARWGLVDAIMAAGTPPTRSVRFDQGVAGFTARVPACDGVDMMCSPRRTLLDKVLLDAARAAGAEVRENFITEDLLTDGGTVTGIRGQEKGSPSVAERARLVIGADGKHSTVARAVRAGSYRARPPRSMAFYTYWADVPVTGGELYARPGCAVGAWPTNDGLVMTYLAWPNARLGGDRPLATALAGYQRARDRAGRPMYDFTARLAALSPPSPGENALFEALSRSRPDADRFIAMLAGVVPVREFMSPRNIVGLVGVRGFARLVAGQARRGQPPAGPAEPVPGGGEPEPQRAR
jgi:hypothetical protein